MICIECRHEVDYFEIVEFFGDKYGRCRQCAEGDDLMKSIANMEKVFNEYIEELDSRIIYINKRIFDEQKKYNKYISVFIEGALLVGDLLNRDGFGIVDGEFCGIDEIDDDTGVFFIKKDFKWIFEDDW